MYIYFRFNLKDAFLPPLSQDFYERAIVKSFETTLTGSNRVKPRGWDVKFTVWK